MTDAPTLAPTPDAIRRAPKVLLHDHLEFVNEPVYFYEFEEQAAGSGNPPRH